MKTSALYFLVIALTYLACKPMNRNIGMRQVYQYPVSKNKGFTTPIDLTKTLSVPLQTFTIHPDTDTILYGKEGTIIFINPRCLVSKDTLLKGKIKIELKELYTKEALLKERASTISNGSMLESDGSIYIQAFSENGKPLFIACENAVNIRLPKEIKENMVYFEGNRSADGNMNWDLTETIAPIYEESNTDFIAEENDGYIMTETEKSLNTYFFTIKHFGWINCDRFYEDTRERKDFVATFILPQTEKNILETYTYIVFDSLMSVIPLYKEHSGQWVCPGLPIGEAITCVSIQKSGSHLYYGTLKTHVGDWALTVNMHEIKVQELEKLLDLTL